VPLEGWYFWLQIGYKNGQLEHLATFWLHFGYILATKNSLATAHYLLQCPDNSDYLLDYEGLINNA